VLFVVSSSASLIFEQTSLSNPRLFHPFIGIKTQMDNKEDEEEEDKDKDKGK